MTDYRRIARAISYISDHATGQPDLEEIARSIPLSRYHFHRLFTRWAGVTPKEFLQFVTVARARELLIRTASIPETAERTGLSGTGRLHDLFVKVEGMTPGEFRRGAEELEIRYRSCETPFGPALVASTGRGICGLTFAAGAEGVAELRERWPGVALREGNDRHTDSVEALFAGEWNLQEPLKVHLRGTRFQIQVWEALLRIPPGRLATYTDIAGMIDRPKATRAVGTALAGNAVAWLIPCHRVIRKTGAFGRYRWGELRKRAMIGWEVARNSAEGDAAG